jgi:hypothetical protein
MTSIVRPIHRSRGYVRRAAVRHRRDNRKALRRERRYSAAEAITELSAVGVPASQVHGLVAWKVD